MNELITERTAEQFKAGVLAHPVLMSAYGSVMSLINHAVVPIIEVVGPTGVGKSTLLKKLNLELINQYTEAMKTDPGFIPVIMVEAPAPDNGTFHWGDFYKRLLKSLQETMIDCKLSEAAYGGTVPRSQKGRTTSDMRWLVEQSIKQRGTKIVIIDEAQHLTKVANARRLSDQMDTVKSLSSLTGVQFVMVGTYELLTLLNRNGQLSRRTRCIHFNRYDFSKPADRQAFINLLGMFEVRLPVGAEGVLVNHLDFIYEHSLGCIGILKDWLKLASNSAVEAGRDTLAFRDLEATKLTRDSLLQILQEILEGERSVAAGTQGGDELRVKLGLTAVVPAKDAKGNANRPPVGVRKPHRDLVGV
jgi:hypothetical protein